MKPICIVYHSLFVLGDPPEILPNALAIIHEQMEALKTSGLLAAASEMICGVNGGEESRVFVESILPEKAKVVYHGLKSRAENLTIVEIEKWAPLHPNWNILYFHSKGATHAIDSSYGEGVSKPWRVGMMQDLVLNWKRCVADLESGYDIACSHWMWNMADGTQHIPAGNFLWVTSNFAAKLPSIYLRERIKMSGIAAVESRFESEVLWGNGERPNVKSYRPNGGGGVP
jgi:hypothetical protein